jgi:AAA domain
MMKRSRVISSGEDESESTASSTSRVSMEESPSEAIEDPFKDTFDALHRMAEREALEGTARRREIRPLLESLGARRASEISREPPLPLVIDRLDPEDQTILYGPAGTGKGVVAAEWAALLTKEGQRVLVADFEGHGSRWATKVAAFGADLDKILIVEPYRPTWGGKAGPIWDKADDLHRLTDAFEADFFFVDSIVAACLADVSGGDTRPSNLYGQAVQTIGLPTLSLGHVGRSSDLRYPFGSIFWHGWARVTWSVIEEGAAARRGTEDDEISGDAPRILQNRKYNDGSLREPLKARWDWVHSDLPDHLDWQPFEPKTYERLFEVLTDANRNEEYSLSWSEAASRLSRTGKSITRQGVQKVARSRSDLFKDLGTEGVALSLIIRRSSGKKGQI